MSNWRRTGTYSGYQDPPRIYRKKRRRSSSGAKHVEQKYAAPQTVSKTFRAGYDRTAGYYGRGGLTRELKFKDTSFLGVNVPSGRIYGTGNTVGALGGPHICGIAQGTGESERIGRKVCAKKLFFKFILEHIEEDSANKAAQTIRVVWFIDKQTNGAPTVDADDIITEWQADSLDPLSPDVHSSLGFRNLSEIDRYKVIYDQVFDLNQYGYKATGTEGFGKVQKYFDAYLDLPGGGIPIEYSGPLGTTTELRSNSIYYTILYDDDDLTTLNFRMASRLKYTDS